MLLGDTPDNKNIKVVEYLEFKHTETQSIPVHYLCGVLMAMVA